MPRHSACHRVDGKANLCALRTKFISKLLHFVLRLSECHTIARYDNYALGGRENGPCRGLIASSCFRSCCAISSQRFLVIGKKSRDSFFSIPRKECHTLFSRVERILYAGITRFEVVVANNHVGSLVYIQYRHAVDGRTLGITSGRIQYVVCPDYDSGIHLGKIIVDSLHLKEIVVGNIRLGKEYVHMTRHTTGHGVDGKANLCAPFAKSIGKMFHFVLSLSQCHTIAGYDNHSLGCGEDSPCRGFIVSFGFRSCCATTYQRFLVISKKSRDGFFSIPCKESDALFSRVERILYAGITRFEVVVADNHVGSLIHIQYRHAVDGRTLGIASSRVQYVVCPNYDSGIHFGKVIVDSLHLKEIVVGNIRLGKEYVHMTRHTSCHRMDGKANLCAPLAESIRKLLYLVLSLSQRHTIARYDNYALGGGEYHTGGFLYFYFGSSSR